ncbi:ArsR/SmtB family transcription factor [Desulforamulus aquiferis]|uniref:Metalloregulator ArsR/SmtB family transcription factor n=1 Tax=Desulforamulus aquiferis TaxID=1397668 RepID=A0AAW7Z9R4_9FIRM|nr:metalloregulator ArsR/SmtB family transcription factor [Desulforamulus aquiferis]MDO7786056.1 metalloregulator ArsR/SmtB family transcription factor [Desulforamulus aquiferis]
MERCQEFCVNHEKTTKLKPAVEEAARLAPLFKALSDETRVKIIYALAQEELCVCDLAEITGCTLPAVSHHLRILRNIGLATSRKEGKFVYYNIDDHHVSSIINAAFEHLKEGKIHG